MITPVVARASLPRPRKIAPLARFSHPALLPAQRRRRQEEDWRVGDGRRRLLLGARRHLRERGDADGGAAALRLHHARDRALRLLAADRADRRRAVDRVSRGRRLRRVGAGGVRQGGRLAPRVLGVGDLRRRRGDLPGARLELRRHDGADGRDQQGPALGRHRPRRHRDQPIGHRRDGALQHAARDHVAAPDDRLHRVRAARGQAVALLGRPGRGRLVAPRVVDPLALLRLLLPRYHGGRARGPSAHLHHIDRDPLPRRPHPQHAAPRRRPRPRRPRRALQRRLLQRARRTPRGRVARLGLPGRRQRLPRRAVQCGGTQGSALQPSAIPAPFRSALTRRACRIR